MMQQSDQRQTTAQSAYHAPNAASKCIGGGIGAKNTAQRLADKKPIESGASNARHGHMVAQRPDRNGFTRRCDFCEKPYTAYRRRSRFCSTRCRVADYRRRHAEEEEAS